MWEGKVGGRTELRSRWERILDILGVISEEGRRAKKTRVMKRAYFDWRSFERYFDYLLDQGFIKKIEDPSTGTVYELTERGITLKKRLNAVKIILH